MRKILVGIICDGRAGGIDKYLLNFYESVQKQDIRIDFLTNKKNETLEQYLRAYGSQLYEIPSLLHPFKQYQHVKFLIQENGYDLVYMNISTAIAFPVLKAAHDCNVKKIIAHSHSSGYDEHCMIKRQFFTMLHRICKKYVCLYANTYLSCSDKAAEWMFNKSIVENKKYEIIYNAIDTSKFTVNREKRQELREELGLTDAFVIGNIGNMCYQKNQLFLIDVFHKLLKHEPNARLVIIGDGVLAPEIKSKIAALGLENKVRLLGRVDASAGYMNIFDVFALPSRFEGLGIVFIEAQFMQLPCVASTQVPSIAKISNMFRFVPLDAEQWVQAILYYKDSNKANFRLEEHDHFMLSKQKAQFLSIISAETGWRNGKNSK